jgi:hypothetical protein
MNLRLLIAALVCSACGASPGSRDEGDACECRSDCRSDLYCADASGHLVESSEHGALGGYCPGEGTCIPRRAAGESCGDGIVCTHGLLCLAATQVCDVAQPEGASCGAASDCQEQFFCNLALEAPVCASPGGAGAACGDTSQCLAGLTCNTGYDPGRCEQPLAGAESDPCSDDTHCGMNLLCYHAGYCEAVGSDGAIYHPTPSTCTPAGTIEAGAPCQQDENCVSGHCIESQTGICTNHNCA